MEMAALISNAGKKTSTVSISTFIITNKLISSAVASSKSSWRGYAGAAAASQLGGGGGESSTSTITVRTGPPNVIMLKKGITEEPIKILWVPDPVTGFYRPENHAKEIDAAELRRDAATQQQN